MQVGNEVNEWVPVLVHLPVNVLNGITVFRCAIEQEPEGVILSLHEAIPL